MIIATEQELRDFIEDAAAFCRWALNNDNREIIIATLTHDIGGLSQGKECFSPRVSGYAKKELLGEL